MVKRASKRKVGSKAKARRKPVVSTARILAEAPINAEHKKALSTAGRALKAQERTNAALTKAVARKAAEDARVNKTAGTAKKAKTAAARNTAAKAKVARAKAAEAVKVAKANAVAANAAVKVAMADIDVIRKKEAARNKAVAGFVAKWEKAYDSKVAAAVRRKSRARKKVRRIKKAD